MARVEINHKEDLERWLNSLPEDQQRQVAVAIACRSVLRLVPMLEIWLRLESLEHKKEPKKVFEIICMVFINISIFLSLANTINKNFEEMKNIAIKAFALLAAQAGNIKIVTYMAPIFGKIYATLPVKNNNDDFLYTFSEFSFEILHSALNSAGLNRDAFSYDYIHEFIENIRVDANMIEDGSVAENLLDSPLWFYGVPNWAQELWVSMKRRLLAREGEHWEVWTKWYDARLDPSKHIPCYSPPVPELERARVLLPEDLWKQGPAAVNTEIKRLVDACLLQHLQQLSSGYFFKAEGQFLVIETGIDEADIAIAHDRTIPLLAGRLRSRIETLEEQLQGIDLYGWEELPDLLSEAKALLSSQNPESIADNAVLLWDSLVSLSAELEKDERIRNDWPSNKPPLDADVRTALSTLIVSLSAYVRKFPRARELDDEARAYKVREVLLDPARTLFDAAGQGRVLTKQDFELLQQLLEAAKNGDLDRQGGKAASAGVSSAKNLVFKGLEIVATAYLGTVLQAAAPNSVLIQKSADWFLSAENQVIELLQDDMPGRAEAAKNLIDEIRKRKDFPVGNHGDDEGLTFRRRRKHKQDD